MIAQPSPLEQQDPNTPTVKKAAVAPMTPTTATPTPLSIAPPPLTPAAGSNTAGVIAGTSGGAGGGLQPTTGGGFGGVAKSFAAANGIPLPAPPVTPAPASAGAGTGGIGKIAAAFLAANAPAGSSAGGMVQGTSGGAPGGLQPSNAPAPTPMPITPAPALAPPAPGANVAGLAPVQQPTSGAGVGLLASNQTGTSALSGAAPPIAPAPAAPGIINPTPEAAANGAYPTQTTPLAQTANQGPEKFAAWESQFAGGKAPQWALEMLQKNEEDQFGNGYGGGHTGGQGGSWTTDFASAPDWQKGAPPGGVPIAGSPLSLQQMQAALSADAAANPSGVQSGIPQNAGLPPDQTLGGYTSSGSQATPFPTDIGIAGAPVSAGANGPNLVDSTGAGDYTGKTIQPGAGVDRFGIAKSRLDEFAKASDPYFQKSLRDATSHAAAGGRVGSGMLRTSLGDLAYNRDLQINSAGNNFLNDALTGSIDDSYKNVGIAQQQQGFQSDQQKTAFDQAIREESLNEALRSGDFSRYYQILNAGEAGNPSATALSLSNSYGDQASQAGAGAANLVGSAINADSQARILAGANGGAGAAGGGAIDFNAMTPDELQRYFDSLGMPAVEQTPNNDAAIPPIATGGYPIYQPQRPPGL
jgi:hypothetical protein